MFTQFSVMDSSFKAKLRVAPGDPDHVASSATGQLPIEQRQSRQQLFINMTQSPSLDVTSRTKVRRQVMRDYHRRRIYHRDSHRQQETLMAQYSSAPQANQTWHDGRERTHQPRRVMPAAQLRGTGTRQDEDEPARRGEFKPARTDSPGDSDALVTTIIADTEAVQQWLENLGVSLALQAAAMYQPPAAGVLDPFAAMSIPISRRIQVLLHHYFNLRLHSSWLMMPMRKGLLALAIHDSALFHALISHYAASYSRQFHAGDSIESMQHRTKAIEILNKRLGHTAQAPSDGTIAAVANIAIYESANGSLSSVASHLKGLEEMVRMRGGLLYGSFSPHVQRLISWTDLNCAHALSRRPRFPPLDVPVVRALEERSPEFHTGSPIENRHQRKLLDLVGTQGDDIDHIFSGLLDLSTMLHVIRTSATQPPEHMSYCDKIYHLQHRLIDISHNYRHGLGRLHAACAIAGLIFSSFCLRDIPFTFRTIAKSISWIKDEIEVFDTAHRSYEDPSLRLRLFWVLAIGGMAAEKKEERPWFVRRFKAICHDLHLRDWGSARVTLESILWHVQLDELGSRLWREACSEDF